MSVKVTFFQLPREIKEIIIAYACTRVETYQKIIEYLDSGEYSVSRNIHTIIENNYLNRLIFEQNQDNDEFCGNNFTFYDVLERNYLSFGEPSHLACHLGIYKKFFSILFRNWFSNKMYARCVYLHQILYNIKRASEFRRAKVNKSEQLHNHIYYKWDNLSDEQLEKEYKKNWSDFLYENIDKNMFIDLEKCILEGDVDDDDNFACSCEGLIDGKWKNTPPRCKKNKFVDSICKHIVYINLKFHIFSNASNTIEFVNYSHLHGKVSVYFKSKNFHKIASASCIDCDLKKNHCIFNHPPLLDFMTCSSSDISYRPNHHCNKIFCYSDEEYRLFVYLVLEFICTKLHNYCLDEYTYDEYYKLIDRLC